MAWNTQDPGGWQPLVSNTGWAAKGNRVPSFSVWDGTDTVTVTEPVTTVPVAGSGYEDVAQAGIYMSIAGTLIGSIGAYAEAESRRSQLKSQAMSAEFERSMAAINARNAERTAHDILAAASKEAGMVSARYGQAASSMRVSAASRGLQAGVGSTAELQTSVEWAKQVDMLQINANAVREAENQRMAATDIRNRGALAGVSAQNLRASAGTINPWVGAGANLLSGGGQVAAQWVASQRRYAPRTD